MPGNTFLNQLLSLPTVQYALLSPDGCWVAFMWYRIHENVDVFVAPTDGSTLPVALTYTPEYTQLVSWTDDSRAVILAEDHDGDEHSRLFCVNLRNKENGRISPGEMQPMTEDRPPYFIRGGNLSSDGAVLYYGANYDFATEQVIEPTWVYRHNLFTGQREPIAHPKRPAWTKPELNRAGTHLLYARKDRHPSGRQYHLVDVVGHVDNEILRFGDQNKVFARWFPDSENVLVVSEATEKTKQSGQDHISLGIYHWPTSSMRWLIDDPTRSVEGAWVSPDGVIVVDEIQQATHAPTFITPTNGVWDQGSFNNTVETSFPHLPGNLLPLGRAADGAWIAMHYSSISPAELVRIHVGDQTDSDTVQMTSMTHVWEHTALEPGRLVPAESFNWSSDDGLQIQGWLYRVHPNPRRAVIYIHGGPSSHSEDKLNVEIQYLVSRGFNVLDVNYRGSTGFGLKFRELIKEDGWGGREQVDIATGSKALIRAGLADPGRVGVTGTSYGGYSSWYLITHYPPDVIGAAAPICGMTDLVLDYETTRPDLRPYSEEMMGGDPEQTPKRYHEQSPIHFVQHIRGKLLIVQGAQDPNVTPENVRQVRKRLEAFHIPYEMLVFDDEGHGITKPANQKILYARLASFFDAALT